MSPIAYAESLELTVSKRPQLVEDPWESIVVDVEAALNEAANPDITFTEPGSNSPGKMFEGVDLHVCDMSMGGLAVCQRCCAMIEVAGWPSWCR